MWKGQDRRGGPGGSSLAAPAVVPGSASAAGYLLALGFAFMPQYPNDKVLFSPLALTIEGIAKLRKR